MPTSQHGPAGVAGVLKGPLSKVLEFLAKAFSDGLEYRPINALLSYLFNTFKE